MSSENGFTRRSLIGAGSALIATSALGDEAEAQPRRRTARSFPRGFRWGAATAGHQVEGNNINADMWVTEHLRPTYYMAPSGDACDSLHRWPDDLDLVRSFGLDTYRFSIEWSRIEPTQGQFSEAYLDFYSRMIDGCLTRGIAPFVTFNHFSVPTWFAARGHWKAPDASDLFARFCDRAARKLADRMAYAATINEPNSMRLRQWLGSNGPPAAFLQSVENAAARAVGATQFGHFLMNPDPEPYLEQTLQGHARAFEAIKAVRGTLPVGVCLAVEDDQLAGTDATFRDNKRRTVYGPWFEAARRHGDFVGVQTYTRRIYGPTGLVQPPAGSVMAGMGMEYYPDALGNCVRYVHEQVRKPVFVTENGIAASDDAMRVRYIPAALTSLKGAIDDGVPVLGYLHWSLIDNYEWMLAYEQKFGLASVDRRTFRRTPKPSSAVLRRIARANALV